jgi:hypothetical protein
MSSDAAAAVEHALWFPVGVFGLAFLLMLALPARRGPARRGPPDAVTTSPRYPSESTAPNTRGE